MNLSSKHSGDHTDKWIGMAFVTLYFRFRIVHLCDVSAYNMLLEYVITTRWHRTDLNHMKIMTSAQTSFSHLTPIPSVFIKDARQQRNTSVEMVERKSNISVPITSYSLSIVK